MRRLMITTVMAAGLALAACGNGDDPDSGDSATVVPESGNGDGSESAEGAEGNQRSDDGSTGEPSSQLSDTTWVVTSAETASLSVTPSDDAGAYLEIAGDGQVGGYTGCNSFGGSAEFGEGTITFSQIVATKRACMGEGINDLESAVLAVLSGESAFEIDGETMTLKGTNGTLVLHSGSAPAE